MKGIVSFSLFGTDPKFFDGLIKNIDLCNKFYPDCDVIVFTEKKLFNKLSVYENRPRLQIREMEDSQKLEGMFWRFLSISISNYDYFLFRDADSRISVRESEMVSEWLASGKNLHIIRDHPMHNAPILGGMWGIRYDKENNILNALKDLVPIGYYGEDQEFIWKFVYRANKRDMFVHDPYFLRELTKYKSKKFGVTTDFIGESFNQFNEPSPDLKNLIHRWEKSFLYRIKLRFSSLIMKAFKR